MLRLLKCTSLKSSTFLLLFLLSQKIFAFSIENFLTQTQIKNIASNKTWQHIILWHKNKPEITTQNFYLSPKYTITPETELRATLEFFASDPTGKCRYPARYFWLTQQLDLPFLQQNYLNECQTLPKGMTKFSVVFIGNYLKNPASAFGHILITMQPLNTSRLLANTYSYGAKVPNNENSFSYITKGLFGLYDAQFSKSDFFQQDLEYAKIEQRDIWEYELNLTEQERKLIEYHLFEIKSHHFNYYFIKQNCAYRTGQLLEFIENFNSLNRKTPWYTPDNILHQLSAHKISHTTPLISRVNYYPSDQSYIYQNFKTIDPNTQQKINQSIQNKDLNQLNNISNDQKIIALEFLLKYVNFKRSLQNKDTELATFKRDIIKSRISLPITDHNINETNFDKQPPSSGEKPSKVEIRIGENLDLNFTLFHKDPLNSQTDLSDEFKVMKFSYEPSKNSFSTDLISVRKLEDLSQKLINEKKISWELKTSYENDLFNRDQSYFYVQAGLGGAYQIYPSAMIYQLFDLSLHENDTFYDLKSYSGLIFKNNYFSTKTEYEINYRENFKIKQRASFTLQKPVTKNFNFKFYWLKTQGESAQNYLGFNYFW